MMLTRRFQGLAAACLLIAAAVSVTPALGYKVRPNHRSHTEGGSAESASMTANLTGDPTSRHNISLGSGP
jgi:hypothetical protein